MTIIVDTTSLWGLLNKRDQYHQLAKRHHRELRTTASLIIPRITMIEAMGHLTRTAPDKETRLDGFKELIELGWSIEEHTTGDFEQANLWWGQYADWPIDYPDALTLATALRLKAGAVWLFDRIFTRLIQKVAPSIKPIGSGALEWK